MRCHWGSSSSGIALENRSCWSSTSETGRSVPTSARRNVLAVNCKFVRVVAISGFRPDHWLNFPGCRRGAGDRQSPRNDATPIVEKTYVGPPGLTGDCVHDTGDAVLHSERRIGAAHVGPHPSGGDDDEPLKFAERFAAAEGDDRGKDERLDGRQGQAEAECSKVRSRSGLHRPRKATAAPTRSRGGRGPTRAAFGSQSSAPPRISCERPGPKPDSQIHRPRSLQH